MNREQGVSKSAEKTKKSGKIASPKITANIFLCFPPGTIWFSKRNCWFAHVNGQTKQFYMEEDSSDWDANSLPPGHFSYQFDSEKRSKSSSLFFSLDAKFRKMHAPKVLSNWAERYWKLCTYF